MIKNLLKSSNAFLNRYLKEGIDVLNNCERYSEFNEVISNFKEVRKENLGIRDNNLHEYFLKDNITFFKLTESENLSMGVFCLAKGT